ncbi:MAG: hypothetical protein JW787_06775 [Sedimentisphaerales bacterium]|nr:hypothetical protein [Sedimentisphaerales bacterium]
MKRMPYILLFIFIVGVVLVFLLRRTNSSRIEVINTGTEVIEVKTDTENNKVLLGQNGTKYFDRNSKIQIGDATIKVGERVEIKNTGSDIIQITYNDTENTEKKMLLGRGGTSYLNKSNPFKINNAFVQIN